MNFKMVSRHISTLMKIEGVCMCLPLIVSIIYGQDDVMSFVVSIVIVFAVSFLFGLAKPQSKNINARDGLVIVALGWILISLFGAFPFVISGAIPSPVDAIFESVSGFTTTGSTILTDVESLPKGILFWRSFSHWLGGMGILVLMLAILPKKQTNTVHIMRAETPGPTPEKIVPKTGHGVRILYKIYFVMTIVLVIFLMFGGMSLYDALIHAFGTAGTGGFSNKAASIGAYDSVYIDVVITVFMALFGINFSLYFIALKGNIKAALKDEEMHFYIGAIVVSTLLIAFNIYKTVYPSFGSSLRYASFQVSSIITTTGYATADFTLWPSFSQLILVLLMFLGASGGSTGGGIKCIRILVLLKVARRSVNKVVHPRSVKTVKLNGKSLTEESISAILNYFFIYISIFAVSVLLVSLDGSDIISSATGVASALGNIGPGLGFAGPSGSFADFSIMSKIVMTICMLLGRLEIYPILVILTPTLWKTAVASRHPRNRDFE